MQQSDIRGISWEAPEHHHTEKSSDWYWVLGIIGVSATVAAILFGNTLFGAVILLATSTMFLIAHRKPRTIPYAVTVRGIRIDSQLYPYSSLESFYIDEESPLGPQLLAKPNALFAQMLILPLPEECIDDIDDILSERLPEEELEEPLAHKILEFFGF